MVTGGGSLTLKLEPDDKFKIINLEGRQQAEVVCFNSKRECNLSALGLNNEHKGQLTKKILTSSEESAQIAYLKLKRLGHEVQSINQSVLVFSKNSEAKSIEEFTSSDESICIISAPGETEITHENTPASELRVIVQRSKKREEGEFLLPDPLMDPVEEIFVKTKKNFINQGYQLIFIPSMRTPQRIIDKARNFFDDDQIIIQDIDKKAYLSSLKLANHIIVTCDSTSMISEAAMSGRPIYVAQMPAIKKNIRFSARYPLLP